MTQSGGNTFAKYASRELTGHKKKIYSVAWSPNGKRLASGSSDTMIRIWNIEPHCAVAKPERAEYELKGHQDYVTALAWKPTSPMDVLASAASTDKDRTVRFWDVRAASSRCTSVLSVPSGCVSLAWSPDGTTLAVANNKDNSVAFVDVRKSKVTHTHQYPTLPYQMYWGPSADLLMVATDEGSVNVHSAADMSLLWALKGHTYTCFSMAVNKEKDLMVSGGGDALIAVWDLSSAVCTRTFTRMDGPVKDVSISHNGRYVAYASEPIMNLESSGPVYKGVVEVLSVATGEALITFSLKGSVESVAWNPIYPVLAFTDERDELDSRNVVRSTTGSIIVYAPPK